MLTCTWLQLSRNKRWCSAQRQLVKSVHRKISYTVHKNCKTTKTLKCEGGCKTFGSDANGCRRKNDMAGLPSRLWCTWEQSHMVTSRHACTKQCPKTNAHGRASATAKLLLLAMGKIGKNVLQGKNWKTNLMRLISSTNVIDLNSTKFKLINS